MHRFCRNIIGESRDHNLLQMVAMDQFAFYRTSQGQDRSLQYGGHVSAKLCCFLFGNPAWEYNFAIITLNLTCFIFIADVYILIYIRLTNKRPINAASTVDLQNQEAEMQKRIARIIITDFACWMPICIIAFVTVSELYYIPGDVLYETVAGFLLCNNIALNPFLYSVNLSKLFNRLRCQLLNKYRN